MNIYNLFPIQSNEIGIELLKHEDIDWYIESIQTNFYNKYMDNKVQLGDLGLIRRNAEKLAYLYKCNMKPPVYRGIITIENMRVGGISLYNKTLAHQVNIGYWIREEESHKGIAKKALKLVCEQVKIKSDIKELIAEVQQCNIASNRLLESSGFIKLEEVKGKITKNNIYIHKIERG